MQSLKDTHEIERFLCLVRMVFTPEMNRSRVHLKAVRYHPFEADQKAVGPQSSILDFTPPQTNRIKGGKRARVRFNQTKQGWCEPALTGTPPQDCNWYNTPRFELEPQPWDSNWNTIPGF